MNEDFKEFIRLLNGKKAEYLLVGGHAVGYYGYPRYTGDIDFWINATKENISKILFVIKDFGFGSLGLTEKDFENKETFIQLGYPPNRLDIINNLDGVEFDDCYKKKNQIKFDELIIDCISFDDLIQNKKASGRDKDLLDLKNLIKK